MPLQHRARSRPQCIGNATCSTPHGTHMQQVAPHATCLDPIWSLSYCLKPPLACTEGGLAHPFKRGVHHRGSGGGRPGAAGRSCGGPWLRRFSVARGSVGCLLRGGGDKSHKRDWTWLGGVCDLTLSCGLLCAGPTRLHDVFGQSLSGDECSPSPCASACRSMLMSSGPARAYHLFTDVRRIAPEDSQSPFPLASRPS